MDFLTNVYGLILVLGIIALIVVAVIYLNQKKKAKVSSVGSTVMESNVKVIKTTDEIVNLNANSLKEYLGQFRNDEPLLIHEITNQLERFKTRSDVKVLKEILEQLKVKSELLAKVDEFEENLYTLNSKKEDFKQRDEMKNLTYEKNKRKILNEIEELKNPLPPPPTPPPPKSKAERMKEEKARREADASRQEAEVRKWRQELHEDPNILKEDIEAEIERRKRARGWLDSI